jgi:Concanavalin A-like lectin/glucanases superfamily
MARQILPIAGAIIGSAFGAPQLGFAIGSIIGNVVDPVKIQGPKIGDLQVQTSRDGVPRPIVFGKAAVMGNIIDRGEPRIVKKKERAGKGGPVTVTERAYISFAVRICEGPVVGISRVWENEKLVYDGSAANTIPNDSAKFLTQCTIYLGGESQMPDPTLEVIHGVGSTPAHRGTCYAVFKNKDVTDTGGAIPQYRFEVDGVVASDPYFADVLSLVHFDNDFTDQMPHTWTVSGSPFVSATEAKFGDKSFRCTGNIASDWITDESIWAALPLANPEFTIEFWFYIEAVDSAYNRVFTTYLSDTLDASGLIYTNTDFSGVADFGWYTPSGTLTPISNLNVGEWYHIALTAVGGVARYFLNGVLQDTISSPDIGQLMTGYCVGANAWNGSQHEGYVDEIRVTAVARYTANFTPPDGPFPNS